MRSMPPRLALVEPDSAERAQPIHELDWSIAMARAQEGDRDAYRRLLEGIAPFLRFLARRRLGGGSEVEDTVQDILLTVHSVRHTYDPARPFGPWLVAIAERRAVDALRRRGRAEAREAPLEPAEETFADPAANLPEAAAEGRALREAVERLPPAQREAIRLLKLNEMSLKEASAATGMSVVALKVATHRGLASLRKLLKGEHG